MYIYIYIYIYINKRGRVNKKSILLRYATLRFLPLHLHSSGKLSTFHIFISLKYTKRKILKFPLQYLSLRNHLIQTPGNPFALQINPQVFIRQVSQQKKFSDKLQYSYKMQNTILSVHGIISLYIN